MSVLLRPRTPQTAPADSQPVDPELLIEEARERQRRRRWRLARVALGLAVVGTAVYALVGRGGTHPVGIERGVSAYMFFGSPRPSAAAIERAQHELDATRFPQWSIRSQPETR